MEERRIPEDGDINTAITLGFLLNRDYGASILEQMLCMCKNLEDYSDNKYYAIPDWALVWKKDDLDPEEGNYTIRLTIDPVPKDCYIISQKWDKMEVHFQLSGDWHGAKREFDEDAIPSIEEIQAWENDMEADD